MHIKTGINILNVSVEILHLGKRLSGFIVLNKAKAGLFLHKISHLTRTTWCTIVSHKPVMSQIPFQNKSRVVEASWKAWSVLLPSSGGPPAAIFQVHEPSHRSAS